MQPYKELESNLDNLLSCYLNVIYQTPIKHPMKYPNLSIKYGSKCQKCFDVLVFLSWLLTLVLFTSSSEVQTNLYIKNSSSDNLKDSFIIHEMCFNEGKNIFASLIICSIVSNLINTST